LIRARAPASPLKFALLWGLPAALLSLFIAFMMMGAGHGWVTPFWFSLGGFVAFPVGIWALVAPARLHPRVYAALLLLALASDYQLYAMSDAEGWQYFQRAAPFSFFWLALWSLWQLAFLRAFLIALRDRAA
jgi:hypothetical protein